MNVQPVFSMIAGMVLLSSIIFRTVKFRLNLTVLAIALFVYASIGIGLMLSNHQEVREFVRDLVNNHIYDISYDTKMDILYFDCYIIMGLALIIGLFVSMQEDVGALFAYFAVGIVCNFIWVGLLYFAHITLNSDFGLYFVFVIGMIMLSLLNALLGIIVVGANVAFAIVQYSKGQPIDLFSFLGMVDVVQIDTALVSLLIIGITTLVGSLEIFFGD
jgi:hypothetical protein